ncbi:hypothetical protein HPP92_017207 [Vanilla planifolia]|uniref:Thioredoxin domain-containing protein n=1 Tax=Vanilla planifolia TaxID=51239 RepID=A0A835Q4L2_VANPL|nr:hypothetical protein HPP92_017785 [Vanilla planifolia]KAG0467879.1 hypothetical protein HPP92_017207 [Vanilla planifolia]
MGSFLSALKKRSPESAAEEEERSAVVSVHSNEAWKAQWKAHMSSNKLMVIDFSATWCGPCRFIEPVYKALASRFTGAGASFVKIDVDELSGSGSLGCMVDYLIGNREVDQDIAKEWRIEAMPTFVFVKGGKEVARVLGANKEELEGTVAQLMA